MLRITEGNAVSARAAGLSDSNSWSQRMTSAIGNRYAWLSARDRNGFVRRCHGDLHLGNICLWQGRPVPFDALEFDEKLATIDVGYDLAFLLMDLDRRAGRAAANRTMNRYMARTGDVDALAGFPIYLSQRAMIRAHVMAAMHQDGTAYLAAAGDYLTPAEPVAIAVGGLQGTGKSTVARALAPDLAPAPGAVILRSDEIRKRLFGVSPEQRLPAGAYSAESNAAVNAMVIAAAGTAVRSGHSAIVDATFLDTGMRDALYAEVSKHGVRFMGFWLEAPVSLLEERILSRVGDASDATVDVLRRSVSADPGAGDWARIDATDIAAALAGLRLAILSG
jgi:predicted kinase